MPYNSVADSIYTNQLCSRLSSSEVHQIFLAENSSFAFSSHPFGGLVAMYAANLRLIEMFVVDFLLVITKLFALGVTAKALRSNIDRKSAFCSNVVSLVQNFS